MSVFEFFKNFPSALAHFQSHRSGLSSKRPLLGFLLDESTHSRPFLASRQHLFSIFFSPDYPKSPCPPVLGSKSEIAYSLRWHPVLKNQPFSVIFKNLTQPPTYSLRREGALV